MTRTSAKRSSAIGTVLAAMAVLMAGCGPSPESRPTPSEPTSKVDAPTTPLSPPLHPTSPIAGLGDFAELPQGSLPEPVAASLQAVLDEAVEQGTFRGLTAAVIVADSGSWLGAAGDGLEGKPLTPDAQLLTASLGKTVTAAQVLRLVEEGKLDLDDPVSDYLPPEVRFFDTNEATIRDVLGMRSGIPDPPGYIELVDMGSTPAELLERVPRPLFPAGSQIERSAERHEWDTIGASHIGRCFGKCPDLDYSRGGGAVFCGERLAPTSSSGAPSRIASKDEVVTTGSARSATPMKCSGDEGTTGYLEAAPRTRSAAAAEPISSTVVLRKT
jgi:hypothetical protein